MRKEEGIYFESIDDMRAVLTNNRLAILRAIRENKPKSVYELSKSAWKEFEECQRGLKVACRNRFGHLGSDKDG